MNTSEDENATLENVAKHSSKKLTLNEEERLGRTLVIY
jgi:hypothetical protein